MAQGNFEPCFRFTIGEEGHYSSTPKDPGNWSSGRAGEGALIGTCWGISAPILISWMGSENANVVTPDFMRNLSIEMAKAIYLRDFWNATRGEILPRGLDMAVWDFAVNAGVKRSIEQLQQVLEVEVDGIIGDETLTAALNANTADTITDLINQHDYFYHTNKLFSVFGSDWLARQARLKTAALAMSKTAEAAAAVA